MTRKAARTYLWGNATRGGRLRLFVEAGAVRAERARGLLNSWSDVPRVESYQVGMNDFEEAVDSALKRLAEGVNLLRARAHDGDAKAREALVLLGLEEYVDLIWEGQVLSVRVKGAAVEVHRASDLTEPPNWTPLEPGRAVQVLLAVLKQSQ